MKLIAFGLINLQVLNMDTIGSATTLNQSSCYNAAVHYLEVCSCCILRTDLNLIQWCVSGTLFNYSGIVCLRELAKIYLKHQSIIGMAYWVTMKIHYYCNKTMIAMTNKMIHISEQWKTDRRGWEIAV